MRFTNDRLEGNACMNGMRDVAVPRSGIEQGRKGDGLWPSKAQWLCADGMREFTEQDALMQRPETAAGNYCNVMCS